MLTPLSLTPSFGFGDRLGLATPGHIAAVKGTKFAPVFAQQSVRENARTGRSPQQVLDDARRAVDAAHWDAPWGADADHLKTPEDLPAFVRAGYTFFTVDPGAYVDNAADADPLPLLQQKAAAQNWDELSDLYLRPNGDNGKGAALLRPYGSFKPETLLRALVKYGRAIQHTAAMYRRLCEMKESFDFEVSVDETDSPTTPLEHFFIANELTRLGVRFTSLAPRFIGRFEKGVDYIGDLNALDAEMAKHAAVTAHFGTYKLSLHSGSDKFSVYALVAKHWGERVHVKTAGTSYLEALRTVAQLAPELFAEIYSFARERYDNDKASYHVSAEVAIAPLPSSVSDWPGLLEQFDAREIFHVTFGSVLTDKTATGEWRFYGRLMELLRANPDVYTANIKKHFARHLKPFSK